MTELTDREPTHDDGEWLVLDEPEPSNAPVAAPSPGRRTAFAVAGLVAAGVLVGAVGVAAFRPHTSTAASGPTGFVQGQLPNGAAPNGRPPNSGPQGGFAGPGQADGEQHVTGTVVSVADASVRIRTAGGTASYAVTAQTEIVRNGALASLSAVRPGDSVFVHLIPSSGSSYVVERLFASD